MTKINITSGGGSTFTGGTVSTPILFDAGTASAPSIAFSAESTLGWYRPVAGTMGLAVSSAERLRCSAVSSGGLLEVLDGAGLGGYAFSAVIGTPDVFLCRESAAVLQLGLDAAGTTNQMFKGPDRITSDGVGGNLTISGGRNRGASAGGSIIFQTSPAAGVGVTGTLATRLTIDSTGNITQAGGQLLLPNGSSTAPSLAFADSTGTGIYQVANQIRFANSGVLSIIFLGPGMQNYGSYYLLSDTDFYGMGASTDIKLYRDAAGVLALRNAANAQSLKIYTTYTDASNYERLGINTAAGTITLAAETLGTGSDNINITLTPAGTGQVLLPSGAVTTPGFAFAAYPGTGFYCGYANQIFMALNGVQEVYWGASAMNLAKDNYFIAMGTSQDVVFGRDAANTLALKNANAEQQFNIYSGNGAYGLIRSKQELVSTTAAGTALTAADFIPDGAIPLAISTYVQTAITITSLTGYKIGDGSDDDRWGAITGHAVGTKSNNADWTVTTVQAFTTAQAITLTSVGANFPAGGKIRVCMTYIASSEPTS